jgi:hypothetical protein
MGVAAVAARTNDHPGQVVLTSREFGRFASVRDAYRPPHGNWDASRPNQATAAVPFPISASRTHWVSAKFTRRNSNRDCEAGP